MKRLVLLLVATGAVVALLVTVHSTHKPATRRPAALGSPTGPSTPVSTTTTRVAYRTGTVTAGAHTDFGDVRVRVTAAHGRIVRVVALELPHGNPTDVELSRPAASELARAVVEAQSADVDMVSGATYTSTGYLTSVQAALDRLS
jgi:uncharacterized protein with FMN-binding domain